MVCSSGGDWILQQTTCSAARGIISMCVSVPFVGLFILFAPAFTATVRSKYGVTLPVTFGNRFTKVNSSKGTSPVGLMPI